MSAQDQMAKPLTLQPVSKQEQGEGEKWGPRYVALWVPDWPLASLVVGNPPGTPAVTIRSGRVSVVTPAARKHGIRRSMTRALAQYRYPDVVVLTEDEERESAAFEALLEVFDKWAAGVSVIRPGLAFAPATGAARWAGGEERLAEQLIEDIALETGAECQVGIASGLSTAIMAARRGSVIAPADTHRFLDGLPLAEMAAELPAGPRQAVCGVLETLEGLGIFGAAQFRALGESAVISRFGSAGQILLQLVRGEDPRFDVGTRGPRKVESTFELDPTAELVEHAATAIARVSADLADRLQQCSLYSSTVRISLETESGKMRERTWTLLDATSGRQVAKRITWQLRGWLQNATPEASLENGAPDALKHIRLAALHAQESPEVDPLWGSVRASWKVGEAVEEVQELLGETAVTTPKLHGGFDPRTRVTLIPWGLTGGPVPPLKGAWEGAVEDPPMILFANPPAALLLGHRKDGTLGPLWVGRRGTLNGEALQLVVSKQVGELASGDHPITRVKRLWVVQGRWWRKGSEEHGARCYLRIQRVEGPDLLLVQRKGNWWVEGVYGNQHGEG